MNQFARSTQVPVSCPSCGSRTAMSIATLLEDKKVTCRHCDTSFELGDRDISRLNRTLEDVSKYVTKTAESEDLLPDDNFGKDERAEANAI
jgi:transcription elongation factor Elf1